MNARWTRVGADGGTPIVAVGTWRNEEVGFANLSAALAGAPVVAMLPPDPTVDVMPRRVDEWVDHHDATLATTDLAPPYRLVGWSFGGVVAVELARRLRDRGEAVEFVGLIDTIRPVLRPLDDREFAWDALATAARLAPPERRPFLQRRLEYLLVRRYPRVAGEASRLVRRLSGRPSKPPPQERKPTDPLIVSVHTAYLNYRGDPVPFPVHLFGTAGSFRRVHEPALRWLSWLHGGYTIAEIPGGHHTIFDPEHVDGLAAALDVRLPPDG